MVYGLRGSHVDIEDFRAYMASAVNYMTSCGCGNGGSRASGSPGTQT